MPNFETFTRRMVPLTHQPTVTIQRRGTISLNKAAQVALGEPSAVELLFDVNERIVGLRGIEATAPHAYPLRSQREDIGPYLVAGMAFTKFYGIDTSVSIRRVVIMDNGILCVDLKQEGTAVTSNRSGRGSTSQEEHTAAVDE